MKVKWIFLMLTCMMFSATGFSQKVYSPDKIATISIKTSAQGGECKDRIERALAYEKGVVGSCLNLANKVLTVYFKPVKTTPQLIRKAISNTGYDADGIAADAKAYAKLPSCSKKHADPLQAENLDKVTNL